MRHLAWDEIYAGRDKRYTRSERHFQEIYNIYQKVINPVIDQEGYAMKDYRYEASTFLSSDI